MFSHSLKSHARYQYEAIFVVSPLGSGTITPSRTTWQDAGSAIAIAATKIGGYKFDHWSSTGSITIANPIQGQGTNGSSTTATINGAGTITVTFV